MFPHPPEVIVEHPGLITVTMVLQDWKRIKAAVLTVKMHLLDKETPEHRAVITMTAFFLNGMTPLNLYS